MRDTCARRRVVVVVVVVGMLPQQVSVSPRHRTKSLITVTSVAISDQGIACVLGWVMALSAKALDDQYGPELSRPPLADCGSPYYLHQALVAKGIQASHQACKTWWGKYRVVPGKVSISSAKELEEQHGSAIRHLGIEYNTAFKLCGALRQLDPPLYVPDRVATAWLLQYSSKETLVKVQNAGHLETWYGERIRKDMPEGTTDGAVLQKWLLGHLSVSADARVCQKWLSTEWGAKGALNTAQAVEECIGRHLV